ncbi:MAG: SDR family oxidoreductase [Parabacteroides sp.]|nr:SDR family oxidoreductase [Parabacteroides sp.]
MGVQHLFNVRGKTALVTGASQGIGRSVALALAEHGANVVINYRSNRALAEQVQAEIQAMGVEAWLWEYDLLSDSITADFNRLREELGFQIDILVLNASIQIRKPWNEVTIEEFDAQMRVNVRASLELIQCCVPHMEAAHWGRIVTLGSVQQARPSKQMIVYAASKAAQMNMVTNLAWLLGSKGITVNNLAPGVIGTVRNQEVLANPTFKTNIEKHIPVGYIGEPNDLASMALLLCSDAGRYISGADIFVDGGMRLPE